ncbi:hypothetical protein QR680_002158 [Steinernema hermaphroditum]|uniref:Uncharacterized protein n=1 Tax=Steinernema hermaphroditum TaxID=289476 RepID=A0AA39LH58_9BILA|nr:hypothetical protein QR680_002158 [Steinernema hermaphroditum]
MDGEKSECNGSDARDTDDRSEETVRDASSTPCDQFESSSATVPTENQPDPEVTEKPSITRSIENISTDLSMNASETFDSAGNGDQDSQMVSEGPSSPIPDSQTLSQLHASDTPVADADCMQEILTAPTACSATTSCEQKLLSDAVPLNTSVLQSPLSKVAPWNPKSQVIATQNGALRAKYAVGAPDEGPTVRQHLQQQQFVNRQKIHHQFTQQKLTGEAAGQALTNSLIQPGPALGPAMSSSPPRIRPVLQIPAASMSAPPPRTDSPSWNGTNVKQEHGDERPDSVASEGAVPRTTEDIQVKSEPQWSAPIHSAPVQSTPTFANGMNGVDISMLVKPGPQLSSSELNSHSALIQTEHGLIQPVAHIQPGGPNSVAMASSLPGSLIIQSLPRFNQPSSLSTVLSTTNSILSGPICAVMNGQAKIVQRIPRLMTAPPQARDEKHYIKKIAFMKRTIRSLVFKNGALCDEVARLNQRIQTVTEERKLLCKRLQHHERNRIRRLQTQLRKADALNAKAVAKETEPKQDDPDVYEELIAKAAAEAQRMLHDDSAEDSERTLSPSPAPSSMSPTPLDEQMMMDDSPSYPYSDANSKENGMDYESVESSPRPGSSPSSSGRKTLPTSPVERQQSRASQMDTSTPPSVNESSPPPESDAVQNSPLNESNGKATEPPKMESRTPLRRSARHSNVSTGFSADEDGDESPSTSEHA